MNVAVCPTQVALPVIADNAVGSGFTVTLNAGDVVPLKQLFAPATVTVPEIAAPL